MAALEEAATDGLHHPDRARGRGMTEEEPDEHEGLVSRVHAAAEPAATHRGLGVRGRDAGLALLPLLKFMGYGRLDAPFWYLGIEEGVHGAEANKPAALRANLQRRVEHFAGTVDLRVGQAILGHPEVENSGTDVWMRATQIMCGAFGHDLEAAAARALSGTLAGRGERLGHGFPVNTFFGELLPLPMKGLTTPWERTPYGRVFGFRDRDSYESAVGAYRRRLWRSAVMLARPRIVIIHGATRWDEWSRVFGPTGWLSLAQGDGLDDPRAVGDRVQMKEAEGTTIFRVHLLTGQGIQLKDIDLLVAALRRRVTRGLLRGSATGGQT
jgi:hypothetical protein